MSELALRDFPAVEPVDPPSRLSMTLLRLYNNCNRSAYLYRKYKGGPASHQLNRGTVAHIGFEAMLRHMIEQGEPQLPMDVAKDIMQQAVDRTPLTIPSEEQAKLRVMAAHFSEGVRVDPETVVGVEQKVILPIEDFTVVGKLDVVLRPAENVLEIWDWKTAMAMTSVDEIAEKLRDGRLAPKSFQLLVYILLASFGIPVETCDMCAGHGTLPILPGAVLETPTFPPPDDAIEEAACPTCDGAGERPMQDVPLGRGADLFRAFEMYPMFLFDDALGKRGPLDVTRPELIDHQMMLEGAVFKAAAAFGLVEIPGIEPWKFEAVSGSHCKQCPARAECPIPETLRTWAGEINEVEQAEEALEQLEHEKAIHAARMKEIRLFAKARGVTLRVGSDEAYRFEAQSSYSTDWGGLEDAIERAATFGEPFDLEAWRKKSTSNRFVKKKLTPDELAELEAPSPAPESLDERFGTIDDVPF